MTTEREKRARYAQNITSYLKELGTLLTRTVTPEELLSIEDTARLASSRQPKALPKRSIVLAFDERREFLESLFSSLTNGEPSYVYIWTPKTKDCGILEPVKVEEINWGFPFDLNPDGILKLVTRDLEDSVLLDFSEDGGQQSLEIELVGPNWGAQGHMFD